MFSAKAHLSKKIKLILTPEDYELIDYKLILALKKIAKLLLKIVQNCQKILIFFLSERTGVFLQRTSTILLS